MGWFYLLIFILFCALITDYYKKYSSISLFVSFLFMLVVAGFRNMGGSDYWLYRDHYNGLAGERWEIGYELLVISFRLLGFNYYFFIFFISLFSLFILIYCIKKYSQYPQFSLMLYLGGYFVYYNLIATRQLIALMIFLFSLQFLIKKKVLKFLFFILFGSLFHASILVLIPGYLFVRYFKFKILHIIIISFFVYLFLQLGIGGIISFFDSIGLNFIESRMVWSYLVADRSLPFTTFIRIIITLSLLVYGYSKLKDNESYIVFFKLYILFVVFFAAFNKLDIMMRIWVYFEIPSIFLLTMVLKEIKNNYLRFGFYFLYISFFISSLIVLLEGFDDGDLKKFNLIFFQFL